MTTSEQINEIAAAMAKAQGALRPAHKDAVNPAYRSKYADLTSVWEACREALPSNGLTVWQDVTNQNGGIAVVTRIVHASGQWVEFGPLVVPMMKQDAHGVGSATSYAKRYSLSAAIGIVADEDDDDGNAASGKDTNASTAQVKRSFGSAAGNKPGAGAVTSKGTAPVQAAETTTAVEDIGIDKGQAARLHRTFRESLRTELQPKADRLLKEWLTKEGFVDSDGQASTLKIPRDLFGEFEKAIRLHATNL